ncbi:MAG: hypothetical protein DWQ09_14135 [Proteobacteria bacterium]|nr:MAG: hypothetical protein DWQ09_14135 [Pseudomonadota bacterium]
MWLSWLLLWIRHYGSALDSARESYDATAACPLSEKETAFHHKVHEVHKVKKRIGLVGVRLPLHCDVLSNDTKRIFHNFVNSVYFVVNGQFVFSE